MAYTVFAGEKKDLKFSPESTVEEILQNVWLIITSAKYDFPLARNMGLDIGFLDRPIETAKALSVNETYEQVEAYEPRARVIDIEFITDNRVGKIIPKVEVEIIGEREESEL